MNVARSWPSSDSWWSRSKWWFRTSSLRRTRRRRPGKTCRWSDIPERTWKEQGSRWAARLPPVAPLLTCRRLTRTRGCRARPALCNSPRCLWCSSSGRSLRSSPSSHFPPARFGLPGLCGCNSGNPNTPFPENDTTPVTVRSSAEQLWLRGAGVPCISGCSSWAACWGWSCFCVGVDTPSDFPWGDTPWSAWWPDPLQTDGRTDPVRNFQPLTSLDFKLDWTPEMCLSLNL